MRGKTTLQTLIEDKNYIIILSLYIFVMLFFFSRMSPFYATNEWADPNVYFNVAKAMVNGRTLYTEVFDHKGPFIFFIYAAGYIISNGSFFGMFIIELIAWLVFAYSIYLTARLYLKKDGSFIITMILPLFLIKLMKAGGSAEEFILIFETVSLYLFLKYFSNEYASIHKPSYMFVHGIMSSMVLFTKINLVVFWLFPLLGIFINIIRNKEYKNCFHNVLAYIGGFSLIAIPIIAYLSANNALEEAYNIYIELNGKYAKLGSFGEIIILLLKRTLYLYMDPISLLFIPLFGVFIFPIKHIKNVIGKWSLVLSGLSVYTIIFMGKMFQYYYPIPYLVFNVTGLIAIFLYLKEYVSFKYSKQSFALVFLIIFWVGFSQKRLTNTKIETSVFSKKEAPTPRFHTEKIYKEIMKEKNPTLLNLGFALGNSLFTTCNIVPNVKYFIRPNLSYGIYPNLRDEQTKYIQDKAVQFIVLPDYVYKGISNMAGEKPTYETYYKELPALKENYQLVLTDTLMNSIDENTIEIYNLYKRID